MFFKKKYGINDLLDLMKDAEIRGAYSFSSDSIDITSEDLKIKFKGTMIEPVYECFEGACIVEFNDETIYGEGARNIGPYKNEEYTYGKYKSREETAKALMDVLKDKECVLDDNRGKKIRCVFVVEKQKDKEIEDENIEDDMEM